MYLHTLKIKKKAITTVIVWNDGKEYKMKKGDKVEFICFSEKLIGEIHRVNRKDKTFDVIYIITPSFNSNRSYFEKHIREENAFEPTGDSIQKVIDLVEADRNEFEQYLKKMELYKKFKREFKMKNDVEQMDGDLLVQGYENDFFTQAPKWKYDKVEPPKSLLILDDCLGSPALLQSSGLVKLATLNRHVA